MKKTYITIIFLVLIVAVLFFLGRSKKLEAPTTPADYNSTVADTQASVKEFVVTGQNFSFSPSTLTVKKGDRVKITFKNSQGFHDFRIDELKVATNQIKTDEEASVEFVADKVGSFEYYCSVGSHRAMGMKGTLMVE